MRWFRRRNPMRTYEFVFVGCDTGQRRIIQTRTNCCTQAEAEEHESLDAHYQEPHMLVVSRIVESPTEIGGREAGPK